MESLPQELIDGICEHLPHEDLKSTLFVSRTFQQATERASGAFSSFEFSNERPEEYHRFSKIYGGGRFRYLRQVEVYSRFPAVKARCPQPSWRDIKKGRTLEPRPVLGNCTEALKDLELKDTTFSEHVARVFEAISTVEERSQHAGRIHLTVFTPTRHIDRCYCDHRLHSSWRVHFLSPEKLPQLDSVHGLSIYNVVDYDSQLAFSKVDPRMLLDLASRCPNLRYLGCKIGIGEWTVTEEECTRDYPGCKRDARRSFADALSTTKLPESLRYVQLNCVNDPDDGVNEQSMQLPNLVYPALYDPYSSSLRILSLQLRKMQLRVMADASLFWPHASEAEPSPFWPNLEELVVMFLPSTPTGLWYFKGPSGRRRDAEGYLIGGEDAYPDLRDDDDEAVGVCDYRVYEQVNHLTTLTYRVVPNDEIIGPFLRAFATAAANMPRLRATALWTPLRFSPDGINDYDSDAQYEEETEEGFRVFRPRSGSYASEDSESLSQYADEPLAWCIYYAAPFELPFDDDGRKSLSRQISWRVGPWRPDAELHELFRRIGEREHGAPLLEHWSDDRYGERLVEPDWFSGDCVFSRVEKFCATC